MIDLKGSLRKTFSFSRRRFLLPYFVLFLALFFLASREPIIVSLVRVGNLQYYEALISQEIESAAGPSTLSLKRAIYYYQELTDLIPNKDYAYGNAGYCFFRLGDISRAIRYYEKASHLNPSIYTYDWDIGMLFFSRKEYRKAIFFLSQAKGKMSETIGYYEKVVEFPVLNLSDQDKSDFLLYARARMEEDRSMAEVQILRSCLYLNEFDEASKIVAEFLPDFLSQSGSLWQEALWNFIATLDRYWWEKRDVNLRAHFDFFLGSRMAKVFLFSEIAEQEKRKK